MPRQMTPQCVTAVRMWCRPQGAPHGRAHRAAAKAADVLQLLQGNVPGDVYRSLRDSLAFLGWQRFQSGFHRQEHQLQYTPQARAVLWGGPAGVTPSTVRPASLPPSAVPLYVQPQHSVRLAPVF